MNTPTPAHRAALTLHSLTEADRRWVLQGLSGDQQSALRALLQELEDLGIPREPELAQAVAEQGREEHHTPGGVLPALDRAGVRRLANVLAREPARIAAALLASKAWPWRQQLLSELPLSLLREIEHMRPAVSGASALQAAVLAQVEACLRAQDTERPISRWQAMRRRLESFGSAR